MEDKTLKNKDCCVFCGNDTEYTKDTPIQHRSHYIEGAGQLCSPCFMSVYGSVTKKNTW